MIPHSRPSLGIEEKKACVAVLDSLQIAQGIKVAAFEKAFCSYSGRKYAVAVNSGTSALILSLAALGVSKGDQVILPSYNCIAILHAVDAVGARPVLVDVDREDYNLSVAEVRKKITCSTKAIIVPHLFGRAARMKELLAMNMPVIEDGTQALGASVNGKKVGSMGECSVFSFYATKMITTGEGGIALTDSKVLAERLMEMRDYDKKETYAFRTNSKMTDFQAAIGIEQLKKLPFFVIRRNEIGHSYKEAWNSLGFHLPAEDKDRENVFFRFAMGIPQNSARFLRELNRLGIDAKRPVFKPIHRYLRFNEDAFPATVSAMEEVISLPIFPSMSEEDCSLVIKTVLDIEKKISGKRNLSVRS